jgi:hypothetical protein
LFLAEAVRAASKPALVDWLSGELLAKCDLHDLGWQNAKRERNRKLKEPRGFWQYLAR